jgi:hypothetical protein
VYSNKKIILEIVKELRTNNIDRGAIIAISDYGFL